MVPPAGAGAPEGGGPTGFFDLGGVKEGLVQNSEALASVSQSLSGLSNELIHNFNGDISVNFPAALSDNEALQATLQTFGEQVQEGIRQVIQEELNNRIGGLFT